MPDLPAISIVVPNYNGGKTLDATLRSLIDQKYAKLEILVMDGGSTDNSVEVIKTHAQHLAYWVSEKDRGQSNAINKGLSRATGDVVNWLCSDDVLLPGALQQVGETFASRPEFDVLAGGCRVCLDYAGSEYLKQPNASQLYLMPCVCVIAQAACFYRRRTLDRVPPVREDLHYTMDLELWCHFLLHRRNWGFVEAILAEVHESGANKTASGGLKVAAEMEQVYREYTHEWVPLCDVWRCIHLPLRRLMTKSQSATVRFSARQLRRAATLAVGPLYGMKRLRAFETWYMYYEPERH